MDDLLLLLALFTCSKAMPHVEIYPVLVLSILASLNTTKSSIPGDNHPSYLKRVASNISHSWAVLFLPNSRMFMSLRIAPGCGNTHYPIRKKVSLAKALNYWLVELCDNWGQQVKGKGAGSVRANGLNPLKLHLEATECLHWELHVVNDQFLKSRRWMDILGWVVMLIYIDNNILKEFLNLLRWRRQPYLYLSS